MLDFWGGRAMVSWVSCLFLLVLPSELKITEQSDGKTFPVRVGEKITVRLAVPPGDRYRWYPGLKTEFPEELKRGCVEFLSFPGYREPTFQVFLYRIRQPGTFDLEFICTKDRLLSGSARDIVTVTIQAEKR
jgi:hypothetical protein